MKTYKNLDDLIFELKNKGVTINDDKYAKTILEKYGYYSIVSSYKDIFKDNKGNYKKGVTFEEIVALFEFDLNIRHICLKYIFKIELIMRTQISELLCKNFGLSNYLDSINFDNTINYNFVQNTIDIINEEINKQKDNHEAVKHYYYTYGYVPPYVLVKILTLGQINKLYKILKQSDRQNISKNFRLSDKALRQVMQNIIMVRNICCHNERFFSFHSKFTIPSKITANIQISQKNSTDLYTIIRTIQYITKDEELEYLIDEEIFKLKEKLKSVNIKIILKLMGIPKSLKQFVIHDIRYNEYSKFHNVYLYKNDSKLSIKLQIKLLRDYFNSEEEDFNNLFQKISKCIDFE